MLNEPPLVGLWSSNKDYFNQQENFLANDLVAIHVDP